MRGTIENPNCLLALGSWQFLRGMSSLNLQIGRLDDSAYLYSVATSMAFVLPDGQMIGSRFSELKLRIYGHTARGNGQLRAAGRVISQCPNLSSLDLRWTGEPRERHRDLCSPGLLNQLPELELCRRIIENVTSFSLSRSKADLAGIVLTNNEYPMLEFKRLKSLTMRKVKIDAASWLELINFFRGTLDTLRIDHCFIGETVPNHALAYPLPELRILDLKRQTHCSRFLKNLCQCPKLERARLEFNKKAMRDYATLLPMIESIQNNPAIDISIGAFYNDNNIRIKDALYDTSGFIAVNKFSTNIHHFKMVLCENYWSTNLANVVVRALNICENLTQLDLRFKHDDEIHSALASLFRDPIRAMKLRMIDLSGNFDADILRALFENCLNLDALFISHSPFVNDGHLIDWVRRGAKHLKKFSIGSENISDEGLIPVIINSGRYLKWFGTSQSAMVTDRTWYALANNCPLLRVIYVPPGLKEMMKSKMMKKTSWM